VPIRLLQVSVLALAIVGASAPAASDTNVSFHSSDGAWSDAEVLFKGRDFMAIVPLFELYKIQCASSAELLRSTKARRWYDPRGWFVSSNLKWKIPFAERPTGLPGYHRPPCADRGSTPSEWDEAKQNAARYLASLQEAR